MALPRRTDDLSRPFAGDGDYLQRQVASAPSGSGTTVNTGSTELNFGAGEGTNEASVAVTGQTNIVSSSKVLAWISPVASADHSADEHRVEPLKVTVGSIVAGTGFTIYGECLSGKTSGRFTVNWMWI